jgi:hypothetical protein
LAVGEHKSSKPFLTCKSKSKKIAKRKLKSRVTVICYA